jgi:hypothetical protein
MKKFNFHLMAQLVASVALTVILSQPAFANGGCPGGGGGYRPPVAPPPVAPPPVRPPTPPPSTLTPGKPGVPGNFPPPPTSKPGLTQAEKDNLNAYLTALYTQYNANYAKAEDLKAKNRNLDAEIRSLESQKQDADPGTKNYNALELKLQVKQSERNENSNAIREYTNRFLENQRKIDGTKKKLGRN